MIEENITKLDEDYMKVWSKYIVSDNPYLIMKDIKALAELAQVDALATYYIFIKYYNPEVQKHVDDIMKKEDRDWTPDESLVISNYIEGNDRADVNKYLNEYYRVRHIQSEMKKTLDYISSHPGTGLKDLQEKDVLTGFGETYYYESRKSFDERMTFLEGLANDALVHLYALPSYKYKLNAFYLHNVVGRAYTITDMERTLEIIKEVPGYVYDTKKYSKGVKKLYKKNKNSLLHKFLYAKNLCIIQDKPRLVEEGKLMLAEIAKLPVSEELATKIEADKTAEREEANETRRKFETTREPAVNEPEVINDLTAKTNKQKNDVFDL